MKEILKTMIQKIQRECNRRENKRRFMSTVAMLCVFSIVSTSVMQSSMIQVVANARTASNAVYTSSNVATPSDPTEVQTPSDAVVATPSNPIYAGILVCGIDDEEHVHDESCYCEDEAVADVILRIHALPTADEVDATLLAYEEAEDWEGYEEYFVYIGNKGRRVYEAYEALTEEQKALVFNIDKLMEWSYLWSMAPLIEEIDSAEPVVDDYTSTSEFVDLRLYNYTKAVNTNYWNKNKKYPGFQWNGGAYKYSTSNIYSVDDIDFGNSMITDYDYAGSSNGKSTTSTNVARQGGAVNQITSNKSVTGGTDWTNYPIGMSTLKNSNNTNSAAIGTVMDPLLKNGYPALSTGESLDYLFKDTIINETTIVSTMVNKKDDDDNPISIDGLFLQNETTGEFSFNSRDTHAQYNSETGNFTRYKQIITPNFILYPFGNFLPFNDITNGDNATQVSKITNIGNYINIIQSDLNTDGSSSAVQLDTMLSQYENNLKNKGLLGSSASTVLKNFIAQGGPGSDIEIPASHIERMYNIDWDVDTEFFFGMDMTMNFMQPKGGMTGKDTNKDGASDYPMEFYFTGDDDVWVYIDGVLFLDLTGIHRHVGGKIDFVNGIVSYYGLDTAGPGDVFENPYATYTFSELLKAAGKSTAVLNAKGTFKDYSTHEFKFFYMERGSGSSVCRLNFNFPLLRRNSLSIEKQLTSDSENLGDPDFKFQVLKEGGSELFIEEGAKYDVYNSDGVKINTDGQLEVGKDGVITIKGGQRAVFEDAFLENKGKYFVRELLETSFVEQYERVVVDGTAKTVTTSGILIDNESYDGYDSVLKDASDGTTIFTFNNEIDEYELGGLTIKKELADGTTVTDGTKFTFNVKLDGKNVEEGTDYTVGSKTYDVADGGLITLAPGETAEFANIIAGTTYEVTEVGENVIDYNVTYSTENKGVIAVNSTVSIIATNAAKTTTVEIPFTKNLTNSDGSSHKFTFRMVEVTSADGSGECGTSVVKTIEVPITNLNEQPKFVLTYDSRDLESDSETHYYKITEVIDSRSDVTVKFDDSTFVVKVVVTKGEDGLKATSEIVKGGSSVSFTNTLLGTLHLEKEVTGSLGETARKFQFEVKATEETFSLENITTTPESVEVEVSNDGSTITVKLADGESIDIKELPLGTTVTVTETCEFNKTSETKAYSVSAQATTDKNNAKDDLSLTKTKTTDTELLEVSKNEGSLTLDAANEEIIFTNNKEAIPDTGILLDSWPYLLILAIALAGIVGFVIHKRKETDLD